jgi:hypothetical protein
MKWRVRGGTQCVEARCPNKLQVGTIGKPVSHEAQVNLVSLGNPADCCRRQHSRDSPWEVQARGGTFFFRELSKIPREAIYPAVF